jgi:hypothetical protein
MANTPATPGQQAAPPVDRSDKGPYWKITVVAPFTSDEITFLPDHRYTVCQRIYDNISAQCATAEIIPTE